MIPASIWSALTTRVPLLQKADRSLFCKCCPPQGSSQPAREAACLDPVDLAVCLDMPLLVINGTADPICPRRQVQHFFDSASSVEKELVWLDRMGHNDLPRSPLYWRALAAFFDRVSKAGAARASTSLGNGEPSGFVEGC